MNRKQDADVDVLALARQDFATYISGFSAKFQLPPHIKLLVDRFESVIRGETRRLLVSLPPRHGKSETLSVHGPAFYLGRFPDRNVIFARYSQDFADDTGRRVRNILASPLHQRIFPGSRLSEDSAAAAKSHLTAGGAYFAVGRGAGITGRGADLLLIDDPLKDRDEASSPTIRKQLQDWFAQVAFTRLHPGGAAIVVSTRWHQDDLSGWLQREHPEEGWETLSLPAIAEVDDPLGRAEGEALWPEQWSLDALGRIRAQLGSAAFQALYQQHPAALEGSVFRRSWWQTFRELPTLENIVISADSAFKTGQHNDFSVLQVWGVAKTGFYLLDCWRGRVEFPELTRVAEAMAAKWQPVRAFLVEDAASGQSLIQQLKKDTRLPIVKIKVDRDKESRAHAVTPLVEAGRVYLPDSAPWLMDYLDELSSFPAAPHDDMVDATTQALNYLRSQSSGTPMIGRVGPSGWAAAFDRKWGTEDARVDFSKGPQAQDAEDDAESARRRRDPYWGF